MRSGNGVHVPLHADGICTVEMKLHRTGVIQNLCRSACAAEHMQTGDHPGGQRNDQLCGGALVLLGQVLPLGQQRDGLCAARAGWKLGLEFRVLPSG